MDNLSSWVGEIRTSFDDDLSTERVVINIHLDLEIQDVTGKVAGSKSARTIVNESSDLLGNATVTTKKFFGPK